MQGVYDDALRRLSGSMRRLLGKLSLSLSLSLSLDMVRCTHLESNNKGAGSKTTRVSGTTKVTASVGQLRNREEEEGRGWVRGPKKGGV
jgi:hypothetical protein